MPYNDVSELPAEQFGRYSDEAKQAAMDAFNGCMYEGEGNESDCFALAHTAAKQVDGAQERGRSPETMQPPRGGRRA